MRGFRNFRQGGPGQPDKKSSDNVFFFFFFFFFYLVLSLFNRSQMVNFKENYHFSRFHRGFNIFQGGGESNCLFPIEAPHMTCDYPGGPDPLSPFWILTWLYVYPTTCRNVCSLIIKFGRYVVSDLHLSGNTH